MSINPDKIIEQYKQMSAAGGVGTLEPLLSLFDFEGNPLSLAAREPMLPLFKTRRPKRMTLQAGRQVSKTMTIGELGILTAGFANLQVGIVEPRFIQKKAINDQILTPLIRNCYIRDKIIRSSDIDTLDVKRFLSGGQIRLVNGFKTADGARGLSGLSFIMLDESIHRDQRVTVYDFEHKKYRIKKICEICEGDILTSFAPGCILYSVAVRDASFHGVASCYRVTTSSGRELVCTSSHLLPTSEGKLRLAEVVEYVNGRLRGGGRADVHCEDGELHRDSAECDNGVIAGRCMSSSIGIGDQGTSVESELQAARVQFTSVPSIIRARNKRTYEAGESRLRRLLVSIKPEEFKNVALVVRNDATGRSLSEDCNPYIPCGDNSPDSAGLVVHGRRVEVYRTQQWTDCDQRILSGGGGVYPGVAARPLGSGRIGESCSTQLYTETSPDNLHTVRNFYTVRGYGNSTHTELHELQDRGHRDRVLDVSEIHTADPESLLLTGVRGGIYSEIEERVLREEQGQDTAVFERVEESTSGISSRICQEIPSEPVRGAERSTSETSRGVCGAESGSCECTQTREKEPLERRSDLQGEEGSGRQGVPSEVEGRSGEICCISSSKESLLGRVQPSRGRETTRVGGTESLSCEDKCRPREESRTTGAGSQSQESSRGAYDRGGESRQEAAGTGQECGISCKEESGTGERSSEARRAESCNQGIYVGEIQEPNSGGTGEDQCPAERASSSESCCGGSYSEGARAVYDEVGSRYFSDIESRGTLLTPEPAEYFYDPIVNIEYVGEHPVYDIEVIGTHNYILANGICSYNCQDLLNKNIPVFEAAADAKIDTGFRIYSGTAKTLDGSLAIKFEQSAQGHWCVKCECGKYVIFAPEEQLFSTITPRGCLCPFCNRKIHSETGGFIFKFPSRCSTHVGYHLPQTIFPFHHTELAWKEIIYKQNNIPKTQFFNEVLGISDSDSVRLLTKADLLNARNNIRTKEDAKSILYQYDMRVLGVDWGGGGGKDSATGICVLGKNYAVNHFETLYINRLPTGMTPEQEAAFVDRIASEFEVDFIAHDYTGAGFMREAFFLNVFPQWKDRIFPVSYSYKPTSDLVSVSGTGSRTSYVVDKTKSLLLTIGCIKHAVLTLPWFDPLDAKAPQLDFLAIIEHEQKTADESATGNEVLRGSSVYLLDKVSGVRDDAAQATNIAFIAMCHTLGVYPVIHYDSKFDISDEQYKLLAGD